MIERAITPKDKKSRFYLHNEKLALTLEEFAINNNATVSGIVNSYILEANIQYQKHDKIITVKLLRQLSNKASSNLTGYLMTKNTVIEISPLDKIHGGNWKIIKQNKLLQFIYNIKYQCKSLSFDNDYMLISKDQINDNTILKTSFWKYLNSISELRSISHSNSCLSIEYFNFLGPDSIKYLTNKIINTFNTIKK